MNLSIVVPVFNEEANLKKLFDALVSICKKHDYEYEILFVDDGSSDGSYDMMRSFAKENERIKLIRFRKNFGQTAAISAGIEHAMGDIIIPIDADMQNDPIDIPHLLEKMEEGYDVVSGWRKNRQDKQWSRVIPSIAANWLISKISGVRLHDYGCTLKAYRQDVVKNVKLYGEMHRFIPIYASWEGARVTELPVTHHPRIHGVSKYGLSRTIKVLLDLVTIKFLGSYATKPIYMFGGVGFVSCMLGVVIAAFTLFQKWYFGAFVHKNPLLLLAVLLFLVGVQFIMMGVLAEISIRTYHESQSRPTYSVLEKVNFPSS